MKQKVKKTVKSTKKVLKTKNKPKTKPVIAPTSPPKEEYRPIPHFIGRPLKYKTVDELVQLIDAYFLSCWSQKLDMFGKPIFVRTKTGKKTDTPVMVQTQPYTITDLAIAMGMTRQMLIEYEAKGQFGDTIKRAKEICHSYAEKSLFIGKNPTGAIFNLKNNYGWKDKSETEHSGNLTWVELPPK